MTWNVLPYFGGAFSSRERFQLDQLLGYGMSTIFLYQTDSILLIINRIPGFTYLDLLHVYGVSRAGYTPQLFSIRLPNPAVIFELLSKTSAAALIYDDTFDSNISNCPVPRFSVSSLPHSLSSKELGSLPPLRAASPDSVMFIFHTSGSTSGTPKLVPCTGKWIDSVVRKSDVIATPRAASGRDVTVWM
jgi:hypothetical protein